MESKLKADNVMKDVIAKEPKDGKSKEAKAKIWTAGDVAQIINSIAPMDLQEEWDNSGMMIGFNEKPIRSILTCLEITSAVVSEAVDTGVDMIVTHHPLIFKPLNNICDDDYKDRLIMALIHNKISVYSCHTPFDKVKGGSNDILAKRLGLTSVKNLMGDDIESPGKMIEKKAAADIGRIGKFKKTLSYIEVIDIVSGELGISLRQLDVVGALDNEISTVGICAGAGAEYLKMAKASGCQLFITGDVKYHQAQEAKELGICLLDAGHYDTEKFFGEAMKEKLEKKLDDKVEITSCGIELDPFEIL